MSPPRPRGAAWLAALWVAGTAGAVAVAVLALTVAGAKVTTRPIASLSRDRVEQATAGGDPAFPATEESSTTTAVGRVADTGQSSGSGVATSGSDRSGTAGSTDGGSGTDGPSVGSGPRAGSPEGGSGPTPGSSGGSAGGPGSGSSGGGSRSDGGHGGTTTTVGASTPVSQSSPGGSVTVQCSGNAVALVSATPAPGYTRVIDKADGSDVRIEFLKGDSQSRIEARCSAGAVHWS